MVATDRTTQTPFAIDLVDVHKTYRGRIRALRGVSLQVHAGEIFGLLGPNGAGKSTLVKIMLTVIRATRAGGTVLGRPVGDKPTLARVGYLPEHHVMPRYLTGRQVIDHFGALAGVPRAVRRQRIPELLELVTMKDWADHRIGQYSKGMMQRIGLAQALVNDPDLVVLDEPTDGVDPVGRREIRTILLHLRERGHTVFLNSHLLSELEMVCDRVAIMVQGRMHQQGRIEDLTRDSRRYEIVIDGDPPGSLPPDVHVGASPAGDAPKQTLLVRLGDEAPSIQPLIDRLRGEGRTIRSIRPVRESLEDLFMRAVENEDHPGAVRGGRRRAEGGA